VLTPISTRRRSCVSQPCNQCFQFNTYYNMIYKMSNLCAALIETLIYPKPIISSNQVDPCFILLLRIQNPPSGLCPSLCLCLHFLLCAEILKHVNISSIMLGRTNYIGASGISAVAEALMHVPKLTKLDLGCFPQE
jgi:hypothetical protein